MKNKKEKYDKICKLIETEPISLDIFSCTRPLFTYREQELLKEIFKIILEVEDEQ